MQHTVHGAGPRNEVVKNALKSRSIYYCKRIDCGHFCASSQHPSAPFTRRPPSVASSSSCGTCKCRKLPLHEAGPLSQPVDELDAAYAVPTSMDSGQRTPGRGRGQGLLCRAGRGLTNCIAHFSHAASERQFIY